MPGTARYPGQDWTAHHSPAWKKLEIQPRIDPYGFERPEDFDYAAYEEFFSAYLVVLTRRAIKWSKLLKGGGGVQKSMTGAVFDVHRGVSPFIPGAVTEKRSRAQTFHVPKTVRAGRVHGGVLAKTLRSDALVSWQRQLLQFAFPVVKRYIRKGIPLEHRARVWMGVSGAQAQMDRNPGYYQRLLEGERDDRLEEAIRTDMNRTFPDNVKFRKGADPCLQRTLYNVLLAYGHHNRDVGYCQGMNFVAGYLILMTDSEEESFWLLDALVGSILPGLFAAPGEQTAGGPLGFCGLLFPGLQGAVSAR
ncbi:growth hormone-regulated TBC protein 1 [Camelus ferus]|nr:growth hormone-regulated TBC protein 1 [Camelus ferus]